MLLSFISSFLRIMTKIRRFPFFLAAAVLALTVPLSALADYPDLPPEPPQDTGSAMEDTGPVIPQDGPLYTDADDWQRYFKWEDDDE